MLTLTILIETLFIDINPFSVLPFASPCTFANIFKIFIKIVLPLQAMFLYKV